MPKEVTESYSHLWHYTNGSGLYGILRSQQLWATNIFYLNDAEEFTGFFDRKFDALLRQGVKDGVQATLQNREGKKFIDELGGPAMAETEFFKALFSSTKIATLNLNTYVSSFCSTTAENERDGLLSQWRGYGADGGYAIVLETKRLDELLKEEESKYLYSFGHWGDVDYFEQGMPTGRIHEETREWEIEICKQISDIIFQQNISLSANLFNPILSLATRHKHRGFREEAEVRISVVLPDRELQQQIRGAGDLRQVKSIYFSNRAGLLVPYISLFERPPGEAIQLPITKIVVGPHPEKLKRTKALQIYLDELGINAEVVASDIPYLGR